MKGLVLCACVLLLASFSTAELKQKLKSAISSADDDVESCMTENNMTPDDWFEEEEIMTGVHLQSGNEEKKKNNGCAFSCILTKLELMEGSNIKEGKVHEMISQQMEGSRYEGKIHKIARKCMKEVKQMTEVCDKGFDLYACLCKEVHKAQKHEEHGTEEEENSNEENSKEEK